MMVRRSHIVQHDQRPIDSPDGVVADSGLDGAHPGVIHIGHNEQRKGSIGRLKVGRGGSSCLDGTGSLGGEWVVMIASVFSWHLQSTSSLI
jgi:hypothetical protein